MNGRHRRPHRWLVTLTVAALVGAPVILYWLLPYTGVPVAAASGLVAVVALKHLGVLAALLAPLYALVRRRARSGNQ